MSSGPEVIFALQIQLHMYPESFQFGQQTYHVTYSFIVSGDYLC